MEQNINFELYKVFYYVAKTLSFSEASKQLYISQSAVSQSIRNLEEKLGMPLFIRSTKKVVLSHEGQLLFEHIEPAINMIQNGYESLLELNSLSHGKLHIGASDTICRYFLVNFFKKFHEDYPNIHLQVTNRTSTACVDLLNSGAVDFIVINIPNEALTPNLQIHPVKEFADVFIANNDFDELKDNTVNVNTLLSHPILMLERNTATSEFLYDYFHQLGLKLQPSIELGSIDLLIDLARIGLGIAFVPEFCISEKEKELFKIKLESQLPKRQLAIVTNPMLPLSVTSQKFIEMFMQTHH